MRDRSRSANYFRHKILIYQNNMMNFLDPVLSPKVVCDKSAMDGYEAKNLLSENFLKKSNGFLAYSTIRPPVELDFELICSVDIHYIQIMATVGNHRSTGLEIFAKCGESYVSIGKSIFDENGIVFLSSRQYSKEKLPPSIPQNYHVCFLKRVGQVTHNATNVKIRIIRSGKYVPCLGSVEIWGNVSRNCTEETKYTVQKLYEKTQVDSLSLTTSSVPNQSSSSTSLECNDGIPEDFKDDLTYELMTMPMTLPSGKTIDQSTLDKHVTSEKSFGRKPGDPFTGIKFTNTMKPVLNVALKCRIDMFMLQNSSKPEFFNVARIVGRKEKNIIKSNCDNEVKRIKLDDGDEISIDTSRFKFKQFREISNGCSVCKSVEMLFSLPCKHLYCRNCLNDICKEMKCKFCSECFSRSNVQRFHV